MMGSVEAGQRSKLIGIVVAVAAIHYLFSTFFFRMIGLGVTFSGEAVALAKTISAIGGPLVLLPIGLPLMHFVHPTDIGQELVIGLNSLLASAILVWILVTQTWAAIWIKRFVFWMAITVGHYHLSMFFLGAMFMFGETTPANAVVTVLAGISWVMWHISLLPIGLPMVLLVQGTPAEVAIYLNSPLAAIILLWLLGNIVKTRRRRSQ